MLGSTIFMIGISRENFQSIRISWLTFTFQFEFIRNERGSRVQMSIHAIARSRITLTFVELRPRLVTFDTHTTHALASTSLLHSGVVIVVCVCLRVCVSQSSIYKQAHASASQVKNVLEVEKYVEHATCSTAS